MTESPEAVYDALVVVDALEGVAGGAIPSEVTLFCYLACLLAMFDDMPSSEWGYSFTATRTIAPYSGGLDDAITSSARQGLTEWARDGIHLTEHGRQEMAFLSQLRRFEGRRKYLVAGCNSGLVIPVPRVGAAITAEPELRHALALASSRHLLGDGGAQALHEHFAALSDALPEHADLFVAAVTWVSFLASTAQSSDDVLQMRSSTGV